MEIGCGAGRTSWDSANLRRLIFTVGETRQFTTERSLPQSSPISTKFDFIVAVSAFEPYYLGQFLFRYTAL